MSSAVLGASTAVEADAPSINLEDLFARCMGSLDLVERVLNAFEQRFEQDLAELEALAANSQLLQVRKTAHRMKGGAANVAAAALTRHLAEIEAQAETGQAERVGEAMKRLRREWKRFLESLG